MTWPVVVLRRVGASWRVLLPRCIVSFLLPFPCNNTLFVPDEIDIYDITTTKKVLAFLSSTLLFFNLTRDIDSPLAICHVSFWMRLWNTPNSNHLPFIYLPWHTIVSLFTYLTLIPHLSSLKLKFFNHGQTGVSLFFVVHCALAKPPYITRQVLETGFLFTEFHFNIRSDRAIEQQLSGRIILGVSPPWFISLCRTFCVFSSVFQHIPPQSPLWATTS